MAAGHLMFSKALIVLGFCSAINIDLIKNIVFLMNPLLMYYSLLHPGINLKIFACSCFYSDSLISSYQN